MQGNIQYISDTLLIEKLFLIDAGLSKQAGLMDMLGGIAEDIKDWAKEHIDTNSGVTGILTTLADLMVPAVLFRINPLFGGLATVAEILGFNPSTIVRKILSYLRPKLEHGEEITMDGVNSAGKEAVEAEAGTITSNNSKDMFGLLREIEKRGEMVRILKRSDWFGKSQPRYSQQTSSILDELSNIPIFGGLFSSTSAKSPSKAKTLIGAIVVWILKTVLLGAGLIAAGEAIKHLISPGSDKPKQIDESNQNEQSPHPGGMFVSQKTNINEPESTVTSTKLNASGYGEDLHQNDPKVSTWYVPVVGGTVESTLIRWAGYVYPELNGRDSLISSTPSFRRAVQQMRANFESGASHMQVPTQFKSIKSVVDLFASDVAAKL